ncbi:MAG: phosphate ABC transporter substrate-binding protein [Proteobacteria bacterium]|nr:phosphate ABC transporter substrate-binding protein [Pseudomonadota bacterium]
MRIAVISALLAGLALGAAAGPGSARGFDLPPPYRPDRAVSGTIRIWGHGAYDRKRDFIGALVRAWERGFQRYEPGVRFRNHLVGTAAAIGSLYTGRGDLALMGREIWPPEIAAFKEVFGHPPTGVDVVTGSLDVRNRDYALVVFVHKGNPIKGLTLAQLRAVFAAPDTPGAHEARTWGDLGLGGSWADRPIHLYGLPISRGFARFFEQRVFDGGEIWRPSLREFADLKGSRGGATDGGQRMLDAMAADPDSIGYAGLLYHNSEVRPVALAARAGAPYIEPTRDSVMDHSYPLTRLVTLFFNRPPGKPVDPKLREFLRYVLSRQGQQAVLRDGRGYLPILAPAAARQREKLNRAREDHPK